MQPQRERERERARKRVSERVSSHGVQTTQTLTLTETRPSIAEKHNKEEKKEETFLLACNALMSSSQPESED